VTRCRTVATSLLFVIIAVLGSPGGLAFAAPTPTPTKPPPLPPVGHAPDGSVVGGPRLASRGVIVPPHAKPLPKDLTARGWVLADLDTGAVLAARDPHAKYLPASTLKILTALTLIPRLNKKSVVVATDQDANIEGSRVGLVPHGHYTVDLLFQSLMLMSGNDAANALARTAGGVPQTVALMNAEARKLQAYDTHAATPSGLEGPGQSISAYDLALISRAAFELPDFRRYDSQLRGHIGRVSPKYGAFDIANQNQLLWQYRGAIGGKTGFTDAARHTYVGAAARHGRRLVITFLYAERQPIDLWQQGAALLDWGFALPASTPAVGQLVDPGTPTAKAATAPRPSPATTPAAPGTAPTAATADRHSPTLAIAGGIAVAVLALAAAAFTGRRHRKVEESIPSPWTTR
jgi:D-alanyl-D-alanine carboxypeptidase (penicillin-binding protein 5/6)